MKRCKCKKSDKCKVISVLYNINRVIKSFSHVINTLFINIFYSFSHCLPHCIDQLCVRCNRFKNPHCLRLKFVIFFAHIFSLWFAPVSYWMTACHADVWSQQPECCQPEARAPRSTSRTWKQWHRKERDKTLQWNNLHLAALRALTEKYSTLTPSQHGTAPHILG